VGLTLFALIFIAVYLQWNSFLTEHKNDELTNRLKIREEQLQYLQQTIHKMQFQNQRLKTLVESNDLAVVHIPGNNHDFKQGTLLWDPQTQRSALIFNQLVLPPDTNLCIWWKDSPRADWKLASTIKAYRPDTMYTRFDLPSFNRVSALLFKFTSSKKDHPATDDGRELAHVSLNSSREKD